MSWQPDGWQQDGWQPDGWQPDSATTYPTDLPNSRIIRLPAGGIWVVDPDVLSFCEAQWAGVLATGVSLVSVAYTLPSGLTIADQVIDTAAGKSAVKISGMAHKQLKLIAIEATLSAGSPITLVAPLRGFNG